MAADGHDDRIASNRRRSTMLVGHWPFAIASVVLATAAIGAGNGRQAAVLPPTIQQTMDKLIDPSADALWDSVGTIETKEGERHKAPRTAAEWRTAAGHARDLVAGARNVQRDRLPVGSDGHGLLADADTPGIRTAAQIRADIDRDPARFKAAARRLELAGSQALAAAQARDSARLLAAGARIDAACEDCHAAYWYPRTPPLRLPGDGEFARRALYP